MTEPTEAMKAMAERIADKFYPRTHPGWIGGEACALAAIIETQRADAELADGHGLEGSDEALTADCIAAAIRTGNHYGKDESNGN